MFILCPHINPHTYTYIRTIPLQQDLFKVLSTKKNYTQKVCANHDVNRTFINWCIKLQVERQIPSKNNLDFIGFLGWPWPVRTFRSFWRQLLTTRNFRLFGVKWRRLNNRVISWHNVFQSCVASEQPRRSRGVKMSNLCLVHCLPTIINKLGMATRLKHNKKNITRVILMIRENITHQIEVKCECVPCGRHINWYHCWPPPSRPFTPTRTPQTEASKWPT